jgi:ceroid-lipofuscinosis MFS transporter 7
MKENAPFTLPNTFCIYFFRRSIPEESDGLETPQEKRERWISIRIIYFTMFLMSLGFSIILTGVWPYLDKVSNISAF